jgi:hypothetical protein
VLPLAFHGLGFLYVPLLQVALDLSLAGVKRGYVLGILWSCLWEPPGSILSSLFALLLAYMVVSRLADLERANGSGKVIMLIATSTVAINLTFLLLAAVLDFFWGIAGWPSVWPMVPCHGLINLAVFAITLQSLANPEAQTSFFGIIPMKSKYYPLFLVGVFGLLNGPMILGEVAAVAVGYAQERLGLWSLLPSESRLARWESARYTIVFGRKLFGGSWVSTRESFGGTTLPRTDPSRAGYTVIGRPQQGHARQEPAGMQFSVFSGRGNRLGGN